VRIKRREIAALLALQRTQEAISGFRYAGTPIAVAEESAREGELDVAQIWSNALTEASLIRSRGEAIVSQGRYIAGQLRTQGDISALGGTYAASAGQLGATSTLLAGVSTYYQQQRDNQ